MCRGEFQSLRLATAQTGHLDVRADSLTLCKSSGHGQIPSWDWRHTIQAWLEGPHRAACGRQAVKGRSMFLHSTLMRLMWERQLWSLLSCRDWGARLKHVSKVRKKGGEHICTVSHREPEHRERAIEQDFNWNKCVSCFFTVKVIFFCLLPLFFLL